MDLFALTEEASSEAPLDAVETLIDLAERQLPTQAASGEYPVRYDHCFKRIAYDVAVGAQWDTDVTPPLYKNASPEQMRRAVEVLREMLADPERAAAYNRRSLRYRDEQA